jgi:hypothetical protein
VESKLRKDATQGDVADIANVVEVVVREREVEPRPQIRLLVEDARGGELRFGRTRTPFTVAGQPPRVGHDSERRLVSLERTPVQESHTARGGHQGLCATIRLARKGEAFDALVCVLLAQPEGHIRSKGQELEREHIVVYAERCRRVDKRARLLDPRQLDRGACRRQEGRRAELRLLAVPCDEQPPGARLLVVGELCGESCDLRIELEGAGRREP